MLLNIKPGKKQIPDHIGRQYLKKGIFHDQDSTEKRYLKNRMESNRARLTGWDSLNPKQNKTNSVSKQLFKPNRNANAGFERQKD